MQSVAEVESLAKEEIQLAGTTAELRELEIKYLGKNGLVTGLSRQIGSQPNEEKPAFGQAINQARANVQELLNGRVDALKDSERGAQFEAERIDITMPGRSLRVGGEHVLQQSMNKIKKVLSGLGFQYQESPELELFKYNFDALNYPKDHPAMDDQDTFYIDDEHLLRTQATALQGRIFETCKPPFRCTAS